MHAESRHCIGPFGSFCAYIERCLSKRDVCLRTPRESMCTKKPMPMQCFACAIPPFFETVQAHGKRRATVNHHACYFRSCEVVLRWLCRPVEIRPCWKFLFEPEWGRCWRGRCCRAWRHNIEQFSRCSCTRRQHGRGWELENFLGGIVFVYVLAAIVSLLLSCRQVHWTRRARSALRWMSAGRRN